MEIRSNPNHPNYSETADQAVLTEGSGASQIQPPPAENDQQTTTQTRPQSGNDAAASSVSSSPSPSDQAVTTPQTDTLQVLLSRQRRHSSPSAVTDLERAQTTVSQAHHANAEVLKRMGHTPSADESAGGSGDVDSDESKFQDKLDRHWQEHVEVSRYGHTYRDTRENLVAEAQKNELTHRAALGVQDGTLTANDKAMVDRLRARPDKATRDAQHGSPGVYALSLGNQNEVAEFSGMYVVTVRPGSGNPLQGNDQTGTALLVAPGRPIEKFASMKEMGATLKARLQDPAQRDALLQHLDPVRRQNLESPNGTLGASSIDGDVFKDRVGSVIRQQTAEVFAAGQNLENNPSAYPGSTESEVLREAANKVVARHDLTPYLDERDEKLLHSAMRNDGLGWLVDAAPTDRAEYIAAEGSRRQARLNVESLLQESGAPGTYVSNQARDYIRTEYGIEADPDEIQVKVDYRTQDDDTSRTTSLAKLLQEGPRNTTGSDISYSAVTPPGQSPALSQAQLEATLQNVDAREGYSEALRTRYEDAELREARVEQQDAQLQEAALAAKLKGQISEAAYEMIRQAREQGADNSSSISMESLSIQLPDGQRTAVKDAMVFRQPGADGQTERLALYAPGAEGNQAVFEFQNHRQLCHKVGEWLKDDTGRQYLTNQLDPAHRQAAEQFFNQVGRKPSDWNTNQVSTHPLSGEDYQARLGTLVDGQSTVEVSEAQVAVSPEGYRNATLEERRAYTDAAEKARLTTQLLNESTGIPSFDEFARDTVEQRLNDHWRPQVLRGNPSLDPDNIEVDLHDGQPRRTLTDIAVHGYDASLNFEGIATFSSLTGQDVSWMNRREGRGAESHSPVAQTVAQFARSSYLGDRYVETIRSQANGNGFDDLDDHRDLTRQSIQAGMHRDALEAKFKGDLTPEQYRSVSAQIDKLSTTDAGPRDIPAHVAPPGMYQFALGGRSIDGVYVLRASSQDGGNGQARDLLYTPDAPDGKVYRSHDSLTQSMTPELSKYFYDRVKIDDQRTVGTRLEQLKQGKGELDRVGSGGRISDLGREFDKKRERVIDDVQATTKSRDEVIKEQVWKGVNYAAMAFSFAVPPLGAVFGAATAFKSLSDGIDAQHRGDKSAALGHYVDAALDLFGGIADVAGGAKALRALNPVGSRARHLGSLESATQTLKRAEVGVGSTSTRQTAQSVLTPAVAVKRPPKELTLQQGEGGLLDGTYAGPLEANGFRNHYIKEGDRYFQVKADVGYGTLRLVDPQRSNAYYQTPIAKDVDGTWQFNNLGLRGGAPKKGGGKKGGDPASSSSVAASNGRAAELKGAKDDSTKITLKTVWMESDNPSMAKIVGDNKLSPDPVSAKKTNSYFLAEGVKPASTKGIEPVDYATATDWYRAMSAEEYNEFMKTNTFSQSFKGYGGISPNFDYVYGNYFSPNSANQPYLVKFSVIDNGTGQSKPLWDFMKENVSQPKAESGAWSLGLGGQGTPGKTGSPGEAGRIFNQLLADGSIRAEVIGVNYRPY